MKWYANPLYQLRLHWSGVIVWLIVMVYVPFMGAFQHNVPALLIMEVSLYANLVTHFGAISGAEAAIQTLDHEEDVQGHLHRIEKKVNSA